MIKINFFWAMAIVLCVGSLTGMGTAMFYMSTYGPPKPAMTLIDVLDECTSTSDRRESQFCLNLARTVREQPKGMVVHE